MSPPPDDRARQPGPPRAPRTASRKALAAAAPAAAPPPSQALAQPLSDAEMDDLQSRLDRLPEHLEPLDLEMIDGYLCGVLLQPLPISEARWLAHVLDVDGRAPPPGFDAAGVLALLRRRKAELVQAIGQRSWFDPWVYEGEDDASPSETVLPWVAGFATAVDTFTALMDRHEPELTEPLAGLYRHLDPDDLEDADELLAEIETLEPPTTLDEAVEDLVRGMLLIADVVQPQPEAARAGAPSAHPAGRRGGGAGVAGGAKGPVGPAGRSGPGPKRGSGRKPGGHGGPGPGPRSRNGRP